MTTQNKNRYMVTHYGIEETKVTMGSTTARGALRRSFGDPGTPIDILQLGYTTRIGNPVQFDIQLCGKWSKTEESLVKKGRRADPGYKGIPA